MSEAVPELFPGFDRGPFVQVAAFVETVIIGNDGVLSLIRVIDRLIVAAQGIGAPAELPEDNTINLKVVICLKPGESLGRHQLRLRPRLPSGRQLEEQSVDVFFEGPDRGTNVLMELVLPAEEGPYVVDVMFGDRQLTRMPFRVMYQRMPT